MSCRESILKTVAFFDLFDYPLTRAEIVEWLFGEGAAKETTAIDREISALIARGALKEDEGLVVAADRLGLPAIRAERYQHSCRKWQRAKRWSRIFSALPGVELIGIANTLAYNNAKDGSDIDFFVVTKPGTIWRTRFFCASLAAFCNLRPRPGDNRDKLCLSFFVTDEALALAPPSPAADIYMHYWLRQLALLYGSDQIAARFRAQNGLLTGREITSRAGLWRALFWPLEFLPGAFLKKWQQGHFPRTMRAAEARHDGSVVISDRMLKFHVTDRRREVGEKWKKRYESLIRESGNI